MQYAIYEENLPMLEKKLNRIANKCKKYGNDFVFEIVGEEIREQENKDTGKNEYFKFIIVEVEGTAKIDNWECIAVLEQHETGNIIRRINTTIEIPARFQQTENLCEHCNSKRQRKNLFVIHNTETNEYKQVGGTCLLDYTSGLNMEYVTAFLNGITELEENNGVFPAMRHVPLYPVDEILGYAVELIEKIGYFNSDSQLPTKYLVGNFCNERLDKAIEYINSTFKHHGLKVEVCKEDFLKEDTESKVEKIIDYYLSLENNSEFINNVQIILKEGFVSRKNLGFLCYLPQGYSKHIKAEQERIIKEEKRKAQVENSCHYGEVGKRYKDIQVEKIEQIASWITDFGMTYLYKITINGYDLVWKTSNDLYLADDEIFDTIAFTVKEHKEYKGEKQTEVTRCKLTVKAK